jgi:hypothetical protein
LLTMAHPLRVLPQVAVYYNVSRPN